MIENTMNRRLFPVFQAANATMTRMTTKITPPVVTSTGRPLSEISANAARASGGTTSKTISTIKTKEAIAPVLANCGFRIADFCFGGDSVIHKLSLDRHFEIPNSKFPIRNSLQRDADCFQDF